MKTKTTLFYTALLALSIGAIFPLSACKKNSDADFMQDVITREDYRSVYSKIGENVTVDMVTESADGRAFATVDGVEYELGMDFLSMAMVYNTKPAGLFTTPTQVYNEWWRLFIQRWNLLSPEVPLYSNQYYDVYNAKIDRLQTNPYWSVTDAIISARVTSPDNSVVLGSNTELSGLFRNASFGKSAPSAADLDIQNLTSGYSTVVTDMGGTFEWAGKEIVREHSEENNEDGTKTYTIKIADGLTFSDGSEITAENYLVATLAGSTKVMRDAGGGESAGMTAVGYEEFNGYEGAGEEVPFKGFRLLDKHTFSVTVKKE